MSNHGRIYRILIVSAALLALLLTIFFVTAYSRAYDPLNLPAWMAAVVRALPGMFTFTSPQWVYQIYGRVFAFFIPLVFPALLALKKQIPLRSALFKWSSNILLAGTIIAGVGIVGDYWSDPSNPPLVAFGMDVFGTLIMWIAAGLTGAAVLRDRQSARWVGAAFLIIPLGGILGLLLTGHIPGGSQMGFVLFNLVVGIAQLRGMPVSVAQQSAPGFAPLSENPLTSQLPD